MYPSRSISRKIETFYRSLDENYTGSQNFGHSKSIQNLILFKTNSDSRRGRINETGGKRNVGEGNHQESSSINRGVYKQLIPCKKEGWGPSDKLINLKQLNVYIPYGHLKMEGLLNLKYML